MIMKNAPVSEIFFSYQGEGLYTGQPQIFVRFSGCNLKCDYCDTPEKPSKKLTDTQVIGRVVELARKHYLPVLNEFTPLENTACCCKGSAKPVAGISLKHLSGTMKPLLPLTAFSPTVSITGGEPLLHAEFLEELLFKLKARGYKIYLETNGTLPDKLKKVISYVDIVSMDFKLASACGNDNIVAHEKFLKIAGKKAFVKIVLTAKTTEDEIKKAVRAISKISRKIPLVLQLASPRKGVTPPDPGRAYGFVELARRYIESCALGTQMHKLWKIR